MREKPIIDDSLKILTLVTGQLQDAQPFYAYVSIPASKYLTFIKAQKEGTYNLMEFGEILELEKGVAEPSHEKKQEIEEKYGANHTFESEVLKLLEKLEK